MSWQKVRTETIRPNLKQVLKLSPGEQAILVNKQMPGKGGNKNLVYYETYDIYQIVTNPQADMPGAITKDNSAVVEDTGINASDGATALRDDAVLAGGNANQDNLFGVGGDFEAGDGNTFIVENADAENARQVAEGAFRLGEDAFDFGRSTVQEALDANGYITEDAFDLVDEANYRALDSNNQALSDAFGFADEANYRALDSNNQALSDAFDLVDEANYRALDSNNQALGDAFGFADEANYRAIEAARDATAAVTGSNKDALSFADEANYRALEAARDATAAVSGSNKDALNFADEANYRNIEAIRALTGEAFDTAESSINAVNEGNLRALDANTAVTEGAFGFADEVNYRALSEVGETNQTLAETLLGAFDFARTSQDSANQTSQAANTALAQKSQDAPSAISETLQKNVLIGLGITAAAFIISRLPN